MIVVISDETVGRFRAAVYAAERSPYGEAALPFLWDVVDIALEVFEAPEHRD